MNYFNFPYFETPRETTCCFTGHRPEKLNISEAETKHRLHAEIKKAVEDGYDAFISGMARGVDIWAALSVLDLKKTFPSLRLICAVPHPGFEKRRSTEQLRLYNKIISSADAVCLVSKHYFGGCYQIRNEWMVDRSSRVIAVCNGSDSGTKNTVDYAVKSSVAVINLL